MKADTTLRQQFIRDFDTDAASCVRTACFPTIQAFDSCDIFVAQDPQPEDHIPSKPDQPVKPKNKPKTNPVVVHNEVTKNVHPRAKMVMAEFEGRNTYYGSIAAAAHALNCSQAQLSRALKLGKTINGTSVITVTPEEVFQMRKKEQED